jgi:hypothetical protein
VLNGVEDLDRSDALRRCPAAIEDPGPTTPPQASIGVEGLGPQVPGVVGDLG